MDEHSTVSIERDRVEVIDNPTGHRFTFDVVELPASGGRALSMSGNCRVNLAAHLDETVVASRARNLAMREMLTAGHIDRMTP